MSSGTVSMTTAAMSVPTINWGITLGRINTRTGLCILLTFTILVTLMLLHSIGTTKYILNYPPQSTDLCTDLKPQTCKLLGLQNNSVCLDPAVKNFACREFCGTCVNPAHLPPAPTAVEIRDALFKQKRQICNSSFGRTLEDNMAVVSNYPLDGAADYLRKLGVFSTFAPPTRLVPVIVTAASANHFLESTLLLENFAQTVIATYPDVEVYFYDIGLTEIQKIKIKSFSFVHLRRFPFEDYPPHVSHLKGYAWKPIIIQTVLQEFGFVIWSDACVRFKRQNLGELFSRAEENGIVIKRGGFGLAPHTDIDTFRFLGEQVCPFSEYNERPTGFIVVYRTQFINDYVMKPWLSCALLIGCMVTKNSAVLIHTCHTHKIHNECHRFDQSVISIILTRLFQNLTRFDTPPEVRIQFRRLKGNGTKPNI